MQQGKEWMASGTGLPLYTCRSPSGQESQKAGCHTSVCTYVGSNQRQMVKYKEIQKKKKSTIKTTLTGQSE